MARLSPRDVRMATTAGGGLIGAVLAGLGALDLNSSFIPGSYQWQDAVLGVSCLAIGAAFFLVSVIVLPALHAFHADSSQVTT